MKIYGRLKEKAKMKHETSPRRGKNMARFWLVRANSGALDRTYTLYRLGVQAE
jgi:hypothetical protein